MVLYWLDGDTQSAILEEVTGPARREGLRPFAGLGGGSVCAHGKKTGRPGGSVESGGQPGFRFGFFLWLWVRLRTALWRAMFKAFSSLSGEKGLVMHTSAPAEKARSFSF